MPLNTAAASSFRNDARVIGLISISHGASHMLQLALPPLFVFLKSEFDVSYAALGAMMSVFYAASGMCQFSAGFAVDRFGARPVLLGGLALMAGGALLAGFAPAFGWLYVTAALMGIGNGVFHPADLAILNSRVHPSRLGHAFSLHGVGGSLGYALAPVVSYAVGTAFGWRAALLVMGAIACGMLAVLAANRVDLNTTGHGGKRARGAIASIDLFRQTPILLCFAFFLIYMLGNVGIQNFIAPALNAAQGISLAVATTALTGFLLGGTGGILAGGFLASATDRHDLVAAAGLAVAAVVILCVAAFPIPPGAALPMFALAGFALGSVGPSRDMIVRKATPKGASGRAYGFVYSGIDVGATIGPVLAGAMLDRGAARLLFVMIAVCFALAIATVLQARRRVPLPASTLAD